MGDEYRARVGRPDGTDQFENMGINQDNIKMDYRYVNQEDMEWTHLAEDVDQRKTLVTTAMNTGSIQETVLLAELSGNQFHINCYPRIQLIRQLHRQLYALYC